MKLLSFPLAAAFAAVLSLTACGGGGDSGSGNTTNPAATVKITDTVVGTGTQAGANSHVLVNYTGWLYSATAVGNKGTQFDTSVGRGAFDFTIGGNVIPGFSQGVTGMKEGGKRTIVIPAVLGYGATGAPGIPPNTDLVFDVELVKVCGATC
jgi:FKBP-type peptidyl-prolyl cis-trans isomerase FkpA